MKEIAQLLRKSQSDIERQWLAELSSSTRRKDLIGDQEITSQASQLLKGLISASEDGSTYDSKAARWSGVTEILDDVSRSRATLGFAPSETAMFVLSVKKPLFALVRTEYANNAQDLAAATWYLTELIDRMALYTTETYQKAREEVISRQQQDLLELSTPVVKLWDKILALPLIGTLDSQRTQVVMETLLHQIVQDGAEVAIIDITGVPTVDTLVAQHLLKTVTAARLMGAECIISGIRPSTAQTIVHLGVDLQDVMTKATLADAFRVSLQRMNLRVISRKESDAKTRQTNSSSTQKD